MDGIRNLGSGMGATGDSLLMEEEEDGDGDGDGDDDDAGTDDERCRGTIRQ